MYFAVVKINFDLESNTSRDDHALKNLCEKLRAKWKVAAMSHYASDGSESYIGVSLFAHSEEKIMKILDEIAESCEESGVARISQDHSLIEHIDALEENWEDDDDPET